VEDHDYLSPNTNNHCQSIVDGRKKDLHPPLAAFSLSGTRGGWRRAFPNPTSSELCDPMSVHLSASEGESNGEELKTC
jgi:hypothetical protein